MVDWLVKCGHNSQRTVTANNNDRKQLLHSSPNSPGGDNISDSGDSSAGSSSVSGCGRGGNSSKMAKRISGNGSGDGSVDDDSGEMKPNFYG